MSHAEKHGPSPTSDVLSASDQVVATEVQRKRVGAPPGASDVLSASDQVVATEVQRKRVGAPPGAMPI